MPPFETSQLWRRSLAPQADPDKFAEVRENLRSAYLKFRERAALLAAEIARDLPDYTVHDVTHIDSLWHLADLIAGGDVNLTPPEAFVLGGAFLLHDLGNGLAAYPDGIASLRSSPIWDEISQGTGPHIPAGFTKIPSQGMAYPEGESQLLRPTGEKTQQKTIDVRFLFAYSAGR